MNKEGLIFDLKSFRSKHLNGMSQEEFAKQIGISQDKVCRMEAHPEDITIDILSKISTQFGIGLNSLIALPKPKFGALSLDYTWTSAEAVRRTIMEYVKSSEISEQYKTDVDELKKLVEKTIHKPKVAFIGRSDVGKSTMINTFLRTESMPAYWTPTTAIAVYVKHINDRPTYMEEEVWVFHSDEQTGESWDDTRLEDESYCRSLKISAGSYDLLNSYGTRQGEKFNSKATSAVVFVDSQILLNCDFVDLPGYGTGDRVEDDALSLREKSKADVLVYLSIANGFMRAEDIAYVKEAIPSVPVIEFDNVQPLANLFIVASQAHTVSGGDFEELDKILTSGCERFEKSITDDFWVGRTKPETLKNRFYYFSSNDEAHCKRLETDFCSLVEIFPQIIEKRAKAVIREWALNKDKSIQSVIASCHQLLDDRQKCEEMLKVYDKNEPQRCAKFEKDRLKISDDIRLFKLESKEEIDKYYHDVINEEHLVSLMERKEVKNKKSDLQVFSSYVSSLLQEKTNTILRTKSQQFAKRVEDFLDNFDTNTPVSVDNHVFMLSAFDKRRAFATGLTGLATYGGLAIWAATCGNLGGYILVAKGVSLLAALGIHVGGVAAATAAVAAIGGPVVLGIALAVMSALATFGIFSAGWKKRVSRKIVEGLNDSRALNKLKCNIDSYWDDTQNAFNAAANNLNAEWKKHIEELRDNLKNYDRNSISKAIEEAELMRNFLQNIPC